MVAGVTLSGCRNFLTNNRVANGAIIGGVTGGVIGGVATGNLGGAAVGVGLSAAAF